MKKAIKKYFIPHAGNNYHPHILHPKRAVFYGLLFLAMKAITVLCIVLIPLPALMSPDILEEQKQQIIALTNNLRHQNGASPLETNSKLFKSSDLKALDMAQNQYFSHTSPENHQLAYYLGQAGYKYKVAGENLAMGFTSAQGVLDAWEKSPAHYQNLVDSDYKEFGVSLEDGYYNNIPTVYIVQHFGTPKPVLAQTPGSIPTIQTVLSEKIGSQIQTATTTSAVSSEVEATVATTTVTIVGNLSPSIAQKYVLSQKNPQPLASINIFSSYVYIGFIIFFSIALLLSIFIEIKKQHPHIIVQTLGLVGMLVVLLVI